MKLHPVAEVMKDHEDHLTNLMAQLGETQADGAAVQEFAAQHLSFLADGFVEAGDFSLHTSDLLAIWRTTLELVPNRNARYSVAAMASGAYAVQLVDEAGWKTFPRRFNETGQVPTDLYDQVDEITVVKGRLAEVIATVVKTDRVEPGELSSEIYESFTNGLIGMNFQLELLLPN